MGVGSTAPLRFPNSAIIFDKFRYILSTVALFTFVMQKPKSTYVEEHSQVLNVVVDRMMFVAAGMSNNGEIKCASALF